MRRALQEISPNSDDLESTLRVAALLKQGFTTTAEIVDALKNSAVDLGDPGTAG